MRIILILLILVCFVSCKSSRDLSDIDKKQGKSRVEEFKKINDQDSKIIGSGKKTIKDETEKISTGLDSIVTSADAIDEHTDEISDILPEDLKPTAEKPLVGIKEETDKIRSTSKELEDSNIKIADLEKELNILLDNISKKNESVEKLSLLNDKLISDNNRIVTENENLKKKIQSNNDKMNQYLYTGVIALGIIVLILGIIQFFQKPDSLKLAAVGVAIIAIGTSLSLYMKQYAILGLTFGILIFGYVIYKAIYDHITIKKTKKEADSLLTAFYELVHTVEVLKTKLPEDLKLQYFGNGPEPGIIETSIQSQETIDLVAKARVEMREKWQHTIKENHEN